jgi:hypothetical protein
VIAGVAISAIVMMLVFGAPTFAAMTPLLWGLFALQNVGTVVKVGKKVIIIDKALVAYMQTPAFRAMAARNGEAAIKWQQRQMEF